MPSDERCPHTLRQLIEECWDVDPRCRPCAADVHKRLTLMIAHEQQQRQKQSGFGDKSGRLQTAAAAQADAQADILDTASRRINF